MFTENEVVVGLGIILSFIISVSMFYVCSLHRRKKSLNVLHHTIVQNSKVYELLMGLSTSDFLTRLYEFLGAFIHGQLTMSREWLTKIVGIRRDRLRSDVGAVSTDIIIKQKQIGKCLANLARFITVSIIKAKPSRKRIKKLSPRFRDAVDKLMYYSSHPRKFFKKDSSTGEIPFEEISELLTTVLTWAGAKRPLRMEAKRLIAEIEKNRQDLLILEAKLDKLENEVKEWKKFAEKNRELIDEVLDNKDFYYDG